MHPQEAQIPIATIMRVQPYAVTAQQSVHDLLALFMEHGISAAPVIDEQGQPIGFVSKTDVVRQFHRPTSEAPQRHTTHVQPWWDIERLSQMTVGEIMTPTVYTFSQMTTVADAVAAMAFEGLHHLPVVNDSGKLVGMISALDVLDWMARRAGYTSAGGKDGRIFERPAGE